MQGAVPVSVQGQIGVKFQRTDGAEMIVERQNCSSRSQLTTGTGTFPTQSEPVFQSGRLRIFSGPLTLSLLGYIRGSPDVPG